MRFFRTSQAKRDAIEERAAEWMVRRDRGLQPAEQDDYFQWLREDSKHTAAMARQEATLRRMMQLGAWQPGQSSDPNPDLFAPRPLYQGWLGVAAVAAVVATVGLGWWQLRPAVHHEQTSKTVLLVNESRALPDGSLVELKDGTSILTQFTATERRVRLTGVEAHFTVAKNPTRPFIVEVNGLAVRAVGTAFDVKLKDGGVEVLVTEGKVHLQRSEPGVGGETPLILAGQRAVMNPADAWDAPQISEVTPEEITAATAWKKPRFQFHEAPLEEAVAEFNRYNLCHIELGDETLRALPIGGIFRIDNVDGFAHLLEKALGLKVDRRRPDLIVVTRGSLPDAK